MGARLTTAPKAVLAVLLAALLFLGVLGATPARADSAPVDPTLPATPTTVAADALPTAQINGVVWSQAVVGNTVYVAGKFTRARPAGAPVGSSEVVRNNLMAYDIRTGVMTSWAPSLNAQALVVTASPDGSRIYVGGDFTSVSGVTRNRVAALHPTTGAVIGTFAPSVGSQVRALAATDTTVYLGGNFSSVGSQPRARLAAVRASNGALLPWNPTLQPGPTAGNNDPQKTAAANAATSTEVLSLLTTGNGSRVVAAGRFDQLNNVKATGVGALDAVTGATLPFAVNQQITNQGVNSAVYSLSTDGSTVYGTGYDFYGPGNLEGSFAATADGGVPVAFNSCLGDTYASHPVNGALYLATHAHDCAGIGGFPEQSPRVNKFATAVSLAATGRSTAEFRGQPSPTLLSWFPTMSPGSFTGQSQAGWHVTGNSQYVVYGGEFPRVNGAAQQGLVRYAVPALAPNKVRPVYDAAMKPTPLALPSGGVRLSWPTTWDQDNQTLVYDVYRSDRPSTVLGTVTAASQWWDRPTVGFIDRTATVGATYTYKVNVRDPFGNQYRSANSTPVTAADGAPAGLYADTVVADGAQHLWRLGESAGSATGYDQAGFADLRVDGGVTLGAPGALGGSTDTAGSFSGTPAGLAATGTPVAGPQVFSVEAWFRTTTTAGGKIVGFGAASTGTSRSYDRHVFMDAAGRVTMGVYDGRTQTVTTPGAFNDGAWHHVVGTYGNGTVTLYLDGRLVGTRSGVRGAQAYSGYWRVGGDTSWGAGSWFAGAIDEVAVYPTVLDATQVQRHQAVGATGAPFDAAPTASFTATVSNLSVAFDASASSDPEGPVSAHSWDFGDGTSGSGAKATHAYAVAGTYPVTLTVTDDNGGTGTSTQQVTVTDPPPNVAPTASFTGDPVELSVSVDGAASTDPDGTVASYAWDFGDGATATGATASHTYAAAGTYPVTLTVTDDDGATGTNTQQVTVTDPPPNVAPTASFAGRSAGLTVTVDGAASTDPDGTVTSYAWDFGDGATATGATASHTYDAAGTYTVTLTVTDDDGATGTTSGQAEVTAPPAGEVTVAADSFGRTVTGGFGTADSGGAWTVSAGAPRQSVSAGTGTFAMAGGTNTGSFLDAVRETAVSMQLSVAANPVPAGGAASVYVIGRRVGPNQEYQARLRFLTNGTVAVAVTRLTGTSQESLVGSEVLLPGGAVPAGTPLQVRFDVSGTGTTSLALTVWPAGTPQPAVPTVTRTDTTSSLQAAGGVGLRGYLSSSATSAVNVRFSGLTVVRPG